MKHVFTLIILTVMFSFSTAVGMSSLRYSTEQATVKNPLAVSFNESHDLILLVLNVEILEEQGHLIIYNESNDVIFEADVEVMMGQVFRTIPISQLKNNNKGELKIVLESKNKTFTTTTSL